MQRLLPPILVLILLILIALAHRMHWGPEWLPREARLFGWGVIAAGVLFLVAARMQFMKHRTNIMTFGQPDRLVTKGPFRITRNPMYLGFALVLLGAAVLSGQVVPLLLALLFVVVADRWYIRFEERMLEQVFGDDWQSYRARVRRWI